MHSVTSKKVAQLLLDIQAVSLNPQNPFTWTSGIKSPIYCDNRITLSYPKVRHYIATALSEYIQERFPTTTVIAGTATAGIPHAAWVAEQLNLPMIYVRSSAKGHGKQNQIEGILKCTDQVILIEDLISTGGSVLSAAQAVQKEGADVLGVCAIFTYGLSHATQQFVHHDIPLYTLTDYDTLIGVAKERGITNEEDIKLLKAWKKDPNQWTV